MGDMYVSMHMLKVMEGISKLGIYPDVSVSLGYNVIGEYLSKEELMYRRYNKYYGHEIYQKSNYKYPHVPYHLMIRDHHEYEDGKIEVENIVIKEMEHKETEMNVYVNNGIRYIKVKCYLNGKLHKRDGPAVYIMVSDIVLGYYIDKEEWYLDGKRVR